MRVLDFLMQKSLKYIVFVRFNCQFLVDTVLRLRFFGVTSESDSGVFSTSNFSPFRTFGSWNESIVS